MAESIYRRIYAEVKRVPRGRVATYGQIAALAGFPRHARQVGYALHALRAGEESVPWHRIVNGRGEVSPRSVPGWDEIQRDLLEDEDVEFDARGRIDLERYQWRPRPKRAVATPNARGARRDTRKRRRS